MGASGPVCRLQEDRWSCEGVRYICWEEPLGPGRRFPAPPPPLGTTRDASPHGEGGAGNMAQAEHARQQGLGGGRQCPHSLLCGQGS